MTELLKYLEGKSANAPAFKTFDHFAKANRSMVQAADTAEKGMLRGALAYVLAEYAMRGGNSHSKDYAALSAKQVFGNAPKTKDLKGQELAEAKREGARIRKRIQLVSDLVEHHAYAFFVETNRFERGDEATYIQAALRFARTADMKAAINAKEAAKAQEAADKALAKKQAENAAAQNEGEEEEQQSVAKEATLAALVKAAEGVMALAKAGDADAKATLAALVKAAEGVMASNAEGEEQGDAEGDAEDASAIEGGSLWLQGEAPAIQRKRKRNAAQVAAIINEEAALKADERKAARVAAIVAEETALRAIDRHRKRERLKAEAQAREAALKAQIEETPLTEEAAA